MKAHISYLRLLFSLICLLINSVLFCQDDLYDYISQLGFSHHEVGLENDDQKVEYVKSLPNTTQRGVIIYVQGSLPYPLFYVKDGGFRTSIPFDYKGFKKDYQIVFISKPGVRIIEFEEDLNDQNLAVDELNNFRNIYLQRNYLDYYVNSINAVIEAVLKEKNDYEDVVIVGHSQGAKVATKVCSINDKISHLIYLSGNPLGRIDSLVRNIRAKELRGDISGKEAQQQIIEVYEKWEEIVRNKSSLEVKEGDSNNTWYTFSESTIDDLLSLDIPIYVGYGTRDIDARYCDLLPLHFIKAGKKNLTMAARIGYDHSFIRVVEKMDDESDSDSKDYIFDDVMNNSLQWVMKN